MPKKSKWASSWMLRARSLRKMAAPLSTATSTMDCPAKSRVISAPISATRRATWSRPSRTFKSAIVPPFPRSEAKTIGQQLVDAALFPSLRGAEQHHRLRAELEDHLPAGAAGGAGKPLAVHHCDRPRPQPAPFPRHCGMDGGALGAVGQPVGGVLHIAARIDGAFRAQNGGANQEARVGSVGAPQRRLCGPLQA